MSTLERIFLSRARGEVFRLLFGVLERELHVRAIEREAGLTIGAVREELKKLEALDLVTARRDGNRPY
jgi:DNA-binding transcriptional ArsR family regulator